MSEIRQNVATQDWVIIATERAHRPEDFIPPADRCLTADRPEFVAACPFCPGNERMSCDPVALRTDAAGDWTLRLVANKYPALRPQGSTARHLDRLDRRMDAVGHHEVLIEARAHNTTTALLPVEQVRAVLEVFRERGRQLAAEPDVLQVIFFKNHGVAGGISLEHPHWQLIALPIVPNHIRTRLETAMRWYDEHGQCVYCEMWRSESQQGQRVVEENEHFVAFVPFAAFSPFHIWILPKAHSPLFFTLSDAALQGLAELLRGTLRRLYLGLSDPDYNVILRMAPMAYERVHWFHWYVTIVPKVSRLAGFELGSGMYINTARPEDSARFLREIDLGEP
ncbi:MAG: galactose-1-phosphate uridylyltransferase [Deltaproteobacteria bacterium]|nr:galactose-1-phosphate uridylyltransferase [Deltaproteobacteria bacterium]